MTHLLPSITKISIGSSEKDLCWRFRVCILGISVTFPHIHEISVWTSCVWCWFFDKTKTQKYFHEFFFLIFSSFLKKFRENRMIDELYRLTDLDLFSGRTNDTCCKTRYQKRGRNYQ